MAKKRSARAGDADAEEKTGYSLDPLRGLVGRTRQLVDWMSAAFQHREEFPPAVIIAVVGDYLRQYDQSVDELKTAAAEASTQRKRLAEVGAALQDAARELEAAIDELKLRRVIGELSQADFQAREAEARAESDTDDLPAVRDAIEEIDVALAEVGAVQARVAELRRNHEAITSGGAASPPAPAPAPAPSAAAPTEETHHADDAPPPADEDDELGDAAYAAGGGANDEEWEVGTGSPKAAAASDAPVRPSAPDATASSTDDLMATGMITARPDIGLAAPPQPPPAALGTPASAAGEGPRLYVVAPDAPEKLYPFTGEVMSMGRGRNNDIQIKNDGKISRYHCRIFRRGDEFIIEDNKSSNGTLVNGKLVTRQRLDGGEQVQIGETRMTFQV